MKLSIKGLSKWNEIDKVRLIERMHNGLVAPWITKKTGINILVGVKPQMTKEEEGVYKITVPGTGIVYRLHYKGDDLQLSIPKMSSKEEDYFIGMLAGAVKSLIPMGSQMLKSVVGEKNSGMVDKIGGLLEGAANIAQGNYLEGAQGLLKSATSKAKSVSPDRLKMSTGMGYKEIKAAEGASSDIDFIKRGLEKLTAQVNALTNSIRGNVNNAQSYADLINIGTALEPFNEQLPI